MSYYIKWSKISCHQYLFIDIDLERYTEVKRVTDIINNANIKYFVSLITRLLSIGSFYFLVSTPHIYLELKGSDAQKPSYKGNKIFYLCIISVTHFMIPDKYNYTNLT